MPATNSAFSDATKSQSCDVVLTAYNKSNKITTVEMHTFAVHDVPHMFGSSSVHTTSMYFDSQHAHLSCIFIYVLLSNLNHFTRTSQHISSPHMTSLHITSHHLTQCYVHNINTIYHFFLVLYCFNRLSNRKSMPAPFWHSFNQKYWFKYYMHLLSTTRRWHFCL
jgi:hypothetical protein